MKRIYYILLLSALCLCQGLKAQVLVSDSGRVHISTGDETTYRYYYLDIRGYDYLKWMDANYNTFTVNLGQTASDTVTVDYPYLLFKNYQTNTENSLEVLNIYTLATTPGESKGYKKIPVHNALEKTMSLKAPLSETGTECRPRFSLQSVTRNVPELLTTDESGKSYMNTGAMISLLVGAYQSLKAQSDDLGRQIEALKATIGTESPTGIPQVGPADACRIYGNTPNPFHTTTSVAVSIPQGVANATLRISSGHGVVVRNIPVTGKGSVNMAVDGSTWEEGIYLCSLIADGTVIGTVKLVKK